MKYGIISIDLGSVNLGNRLIEHCVKYMMNLPAPSVSISMFKQPTQEDVSKLNCCDFVLLPGSTILAKGKGESFALSILSKIKVPIICAAASTWAPRYKPYYEIFKYIKTPIGCRDPITKKILDKAGIENILIGCPTAYMPTLDKQISDYYIFGFHRGFSQWQISLVNKIKQKSKVIIAVQENYEKGYAKGTKCGFFTYENTEDVFEMYASCIRTYTGRLHGVLPAMSQKKTVAFFGDVLDSRFSLLKHLGVTVNKIGVKKFVTSTPTMYEHRLCKLRDNFIRWKNLVL
jgi:hypothetical protein